MSNEGEKKLKPFELILQKELLDLDEINGVELFQVNYEDLKEIGVSITSQDGFFRNKTVKFIIKFKDTYPITPPKISCLTKEPSTNDPFNVDAANVLKNDKQKFIEINNALFYETN
ncbi:NEDD8-conjugating enzyme UBC12, putative [Plasmodium yoelii]|uniref:NEDD8-conjugating enzyme UBC12, putative n=1 Tax=Plasmodium yoelii TaxID=5861 RepID=A0A077YCQ2_PLAYE|nr:NEDD8-conjugating enzyme UBC12, putative [Plasmodium yoelii]